MTKSLHTLRHTPAGDWICRAALVFVTGVSIAVAQQLPMKAVPRRPPLNASSIRKIDELGWVKLEDVTTVPAALTNQACAALEQRNVIEARRIVSMMSEEDVKAYFTAHIDYEVGFIAGEPQSRYAALLLKKGKELPLAYQLAGVKILREARSSDETAPQPSTEVLTAAEHRKCHTGLEFALFASCEIALRLGGLERAREVMRNCIVLYHDTPSLIEYCAATYETHTSTLSPHGKPVPNVPAGVSANLQQAISLRSSIRAKFPAYERNYFHLADDLHRSGRNAEARQCLAAYFQRFGDNAKDSDRNHRLLNQCGR